MSDIWNQPSGSTLATLGERLTTIVALPLTTAEQDATVTLISGQYPLGMRLENNALVGTPFQVARDKLYKFVVRGVTVEGIFEDRTYSILVQGPDAPVWITEEDLLPVGANGLFFIIDSSPVDFQLQAIDEDLPAGDEVQFFIADDSGLLPPGLSLTQSGRISGIVDPILALDKAAGTGEFDSNGYDAYPYDFSVLSASGYDSFFYDSGFYDDKIPTRSPRKLNRFYEFTVTASDGDTEVKRTFRIYVVGDDFLRADNTVMQAATGLFTADNTQIRTPIWLTSSALGFKRADNYLTLFLDTLDLNTTQGVIRYELLATNEDGSLSTIPAGMTLDTVSGEVYGRVPYQQTVTKDYNFTVRARRFTGEVSQANIVALAQRDVKNGFRQIRVNNLSRSNADGVDDLTALVGQSVNIDGNNYTISSVNGTNADYDLITLGTNLKASFRVTVRETAAVGQGFVYVNELSEAQKKRLVGREIRFLETEVYIVDSITPYTTWSIQYSDGTGIQADAGAAGLAVIPGEDVSDTIQRIWPTSTHEITVDNLLLLTVVSTAQNRNSTFIQSVFAPSNPGTTINSSLIAFFDRIVFDILLQRQLTQDGDIGIGAFKDSSFGAIVTVSSGSDTTQPFKDRAFTLTMLGDVESKITWTTGPYLGTINANFLSTFAVIATTTAPSKLLYRVVGGKLPPGLTLSFDGEIIGKVNQFEEESTPGLTIFDGGATVWDSFSPTDTTFDRSFMFTVEARDRFNFSATTRSFTIDIFDPNDLLYSNLFFRPLLPLAQRDSFTQLTGNPDIFPPGAIYRPNDPDFGIQNEIKMLAYAGIETKTIDEYVAAATKNHKRLRFRLGDLKTAVAINPGTNEVIYEVVYVDVIDKYAPLASKGNARESYAIQNKSKITVDSNTYARKNDQFPDGSGLPEMYIDGVRVAIEQLYHIAGASDNNITVGDLDVRDAAGNVVNVTAYTDSDPYAIARRGGLNTITTDNNAVRVGNVSDVTRHITSVANMRARIAEVGDSERNFLPLWMRTTQGNMIQEIGYVLALPICYTKPGNSAQIKINIERSDFDFKTLSLEVDRYIIDSTTDTVGERFIVFENYQFNI
tara:strand:- start:4008 stop:7283 length:3276 start_codon:yes stop_codon:yes gene_type:complete